MSKSKQYAGHTPYAEDYRAVKVGEYRDFPTPGAASYFRVVLRRAGRKGRREAIGSGFRVWRTA